MFNLLSAKSELNKFDRQNFLNMPFFCFLKIMLSFNLNVKVILSILCFKLIVNIFAFLWRANGLGNKRCQTIPVSCLIARESEI
jgi:hypothetical protein